MFGTVFLVVAVLAYGNCESTACNVTDTTADCGVDFEFPLDVDRNITKLIVRSKHVKSIEYEDIAQYTALEEIDLSNCAVQNINPDAFIDNTNLKELILSGNKNLKLPENGTFINSDSLQTLNLSDTDITIDALQPDIFEGAPYLVNIDLSLNTIQDLDATPFATTKDLATLILSKDDSINIKSLCDTEIQQIIFKIYENETEEIYDCKKLKFEQDGLIETSTTISTSGEDLTTDQDPELTSINPPEETTIAFDDDTLDSIPLLHNSIQVNETSEEIIVTEENITVDESVTQLVVDEVPVTEQNATEESIVDEATSADVETRLLAAQNEDNKDDDTDKTAPTTAAIGKSGTNIVLGIILCVMVVGALGFAYKYYKNRKSGYRTANTDDKEEEEGKELQTIITHPRDTTEQTN